MALTIVATPGAANANSYLTLAEAVAYFEGRATAQEWEDADSQEALLVMATRVLDAVLSPGRQLILGDDCECSYYRIRPHWTGAPATEAQALAWPRTGMYNRNGFAIASTVVPQDLKNAVAELAYQLAREDRTLDNDVAVKGIRSVQAGSVSVSFKDGMIDDVRMLPQAVLYLLVPSWIADEVKEYTNTLEFEVIP